MKIPPEKEVQREKSVKVEYSQKVRNEFNEFHFGRMNFWKIITGTTLMLGSFCLNFLNEKIILAISALIYINSPI
jgi:hypothetical protein